MNSLDLLPQEKLDKIAEVANRAANIAVETGQDPELAALFLDHYFRHVDAEDVTERSVPDLLGLVESHYRMALVRPPGVSLIAVSTPTMSTDGWTAGGASVVQIVTDDQPFLVDSVTMEVLRQGWSIREVVHPQFTVYRDSAGRLQTNARGREARERLDSQEESWMHLEVLPPAPAGPAPAQSSQERDERLIQGLHEVIKLVTEAVDDWAAMRTKAAETVFGLEHHRPALPAAEISAAQELLSWLTENHFTFLGYREYTIESRQDGAGYAMVSVPATGLGILRSEPAGSGFDAVPLGDRRPELMVLTKDDRRSRVHRPAYFDYVGIRTFDSHGKVAGERRFLGLFASTAYSESVFRIPLLAAKGREVLRRSGWGLESHGGKVIAEALETFPRDELFQTSVDELAPIVEHIAQLKERRQVRMFVRRDAYGRYVSCLVYLPRDRYTTVARTRMEAVLLRAFGGACIDYTARISESVLARLHFVVHMQEGQAAREPDVRALERELTAATRSWNLEVADALAARGGDEHLAVWVAALPEAYKEDFGADRAINDLQALSALPEDGMSLSVYRPVEPGDEAHLRLKIFRRGTSMSLSKVLPHLTLLGVDVIDERPYELSAHAWIYDFGLQVPGGLEAAAAWTEADLARFTAAFAASYQGQSESDGFNALVLAAGLDWHQVVVLRAIGRYVRQAGSPYSQSYIASALSGNVGIARLLVELFETRFDPRTGDDFATRTERADQLAGQVVAALDQVSSLDYDKIIRAFLAVLRAVLRTNWFQDRTGKESGGALALKIRPSEVPILPEPRPALEIFVYAPRVEGVHLRFGTVARGGLRWSDRAEDFRTEVLGLVKAQMVKNTVIVPVGAKGGFYPKRLPDPTVDRDAWLAEGVACYKLFVASMLDVTDNFEQGEIVPPPDVVCYDGDDPYLVVAADKGTATFSDLANEISIARGFWLDDAFASGGSAGYDHKEMGITARGAWQSVIRHFREMGTDCQTTDFTCVGIGDMSGDVFGNGMLLSRHTRLLAAFDHRHVFLDPDPDPEESWTERARLFALPRSSWAEYDPTLISAGGGVFPRTAKSVPVSEPVRRALGLSEDVDALAPTELISAILRAPVDLLWNGGIGTYVKAKTESHAQVGDRTNDALRVDAADLRARCVGEGGNLGFTQCGRIEYARGGGRINTDFIDNSAGVDTSDHEVNIKIGLAGELRSGRLERAERDVLLRDMTDDVASAVLGDNVEQNLALANAEANATSLAGAHEDWMARLAAAGLLDRGVEFLPSSEEMAERRREGRGLCAPELAVLLAYTKIYLEQEVLASDLPDDPALHDRLFCYFPAQMRDRFARQIEQHRLRREILTTVAVNEFVNRSGITCYHRLSAETGAPMAEVLRAAMAARSVFGSDKLDAAVAALDHQVDAEIATELRLEVRTVVERATRWLLDHRHWPLDVAGAEREFGAGIERLRAVLPDLLRGRDEEAYRSRRDRYTTAGVPEELASPLAVLPLAYGGLAVVQTAVREDRDVVEVAAVHYELADRLGLDLLLTRIEELPRDDRWQTMARVALRDELLGVHARLTAEVIASGQPVAEWVEQTSDAQVAMATLASVCEGPPDLARVSVGLRTVRGLLTAVG